MSLGLDVSDLPAGVRYHTRDAWGLTWTEAQRRKLSVQPAGLAQCFIHHTAGQAPDQSTQTWDDDPLAFVAWLDAYARNTKGYKALDYSVIVHQAPTGVVSIVEGRAEFYPAATLDSNTTSKAICFAGNYDSQYGNNPRRRPSNLELDAGRWLVSAMRRAGVLRPDVTVYGHRDNPRHPNATACPGNWLYAQVGYIADPSPTPPPPEPPDTEDDMAAIAAIYAPNDLVRKERPDAKTFLLRGDGGIRHASGPDVAYANTVQAPTLPILGVEHYDQLEASSRQGLPA